MSALATVDPAAFGLGDIAECGPPAPTHHPRIWRITRHADCVAALRNRAVQTIDVTEELRLLQRARSVTLPGLAAFMSGVLVARRDPFHRSGREFLRSVQSGPTPPGTVRTHLQTMLGAAPHGEPIDLVPVMNRLPLVVLSGFIGLDPGTLDRLDHLLRQAMVDWAMGPHRMSLARMEESCSQAVAIIAGEFAAARASGEGRLYETLVAGCRTHGFDDEVISGLLFFLIVASIETTAGFLANLAILLQRLPEFSDAARRPGKAQRETVEEALRFIGPVRRLGRRTALEPLEIGGQVIPTGSSLHIDIEAAHRDPLAYPDPWSFDPSRNGPTSLAFSAGAHACLGGRISRQMAGEVLDVLAGYDISPAEDGPPDWTAHPGFRIPHTLMSVIRARDA
ncbi:cytochrome P450 [Acuticoccus sediminis]|uniref:cytochrome P450 n=1 Tax=Acuticoccus sediminis TaxID=2184697 RepID=UPI001CFF4503|nr:cytochrome P450 [Acuticoccus sediminis]